MILIVTGQYAGAQYIYPLIKKWSVNKTTQWNLVAKGASCKFWDEAKVKYKKIFNITSQEISEYLELTKPNLIITSTSLNYDFETLYIKEGKKKKIPTVSFIDFWSNYLIRFKLNKELIYPNNIFAIDLNCVNEMIIDGVPEKLIKIVGQPYLEEIIGSTKKIGDKILFAGQPLEKFFKKNLGYNEKDFWEICFQVINKKKLKNILCTNHPEAINFNASFKKNKIFSEGKGLKDILECHTVLGISSMQIFLGYLLGRRVASIQPKILNKDLFPLSRWGLVPRLETAEEVIKFIENNDNPFENYQKKVNKSIEFDQFQLNGSLERLELFCLNYEN